MKTMSKIIKFVLIVAIVIFNQSCSSDDFSIEGINNSFINGQWELVKTTEDGTAITLTDCHKMDTIKFNESSNEATIETFNLNVEDVCEMLTNRTESYTINENTLFIDNSPVFEIELGNNQTLILKSTQNGISVVKTYNRL